MLNNSTSRPYSPARRLQVQHRPSAHGVAIAGVGKRSAIAANSRIYLVSATYVSKDSAQSCRRSEPFLRPIVNTIPAETTIATIGATEKIHAFGLRIFFCGRSCIGRMVSTKTDAMISNDRIKVKPLSGANDANAVRANRSPQVNAGSPINAGIRASVCSRSSAVVSTNIATQATTGPNMQTGLKTPIAPQ